MKHCHLCDEPIILYRLRHNFPNALIVSNMHYDEGICPRCFYDNAEEEYEELDFNDSTPDRWEEEYYSSTDHGVIDYD